MMNDGGLGRRLSRELTIARRDRLIRESVGKEAARLLAAVNTMGNGIDAFWLQKALKHVIATVANLEYQGKHDRDDAWNWVVVKLTGAFDTGRCYGKDMRCCLDAVDMETKQGCLVATIARHDGARRYVGLPNPVPLGARWGSGGLQWEGVVG